MNEERERKKSRKKIYFSLSFLVMFVVLFGMTFIDPELMIGWIWDYDIEKQLVYANNQGLEYDPDVTITLNGEVQDIKKVKMRFTYENNDSTEMRVARAMELFDNLFSDPDKQSEIIRTEQTTIVQFTWQPEPKN